MSAAAPGPVSAAGLAALAERIAAGRPFGADEVLPFLTLPLRADRHAVNLALADACVRAGTPEARARARVFARRAWALSGGTAEALPACVAVLAAAGDVEGVRAAYRRVGLRAAAAGDVDRAIAAFNRFHYAYAVHEGVDRFELDLDVLDAMDRLAAGRRQPAGPPRRPAPGERLRVAYLLKDLAAPDSVLIKIFLQFARHHDRSRFEVSFHVPETAAELAARPRGRENMEAFAREGFAVSTAPPAATAGESLVALARRIQATSPHLLVTSVALADFRHYFVAALRPAPVVAGFNHGGSHALFSPPLLDWSIAWPLHAQLDCPGDALHVNLEVELPRPDGVAPCSRAELGIPDGACVLASGGRAPKYQDRGYWRCVDALLRRHPGAHHLALGVAPEQVPFLDEVLSPSARARVHLPGWRSDYRRALAVADVVLDTYPMGSGVVLMDALALGIPAVGFRHDYFRIFDQTQCSGLEVLVDVPELLVPRGDWTAFEGTVSGLVDDEGLRRALGARCRLEIARTSGDPRRMVARCEEAYRAILQASVEAVGRGGAGEAGAAAGGSAPLAEGARTTTAPGLREAFLLEPDWDDEGWRRVVAAYVAAFRPDEPVALVVPVDGARWPGLTLAGAAERVQAAVADSGRAELPEILLADRGSELLEVLRGFAVVRWAPGSPGCRADGERGVRFAAALESAGAPAAAPRRALRVARSGR